MICRLSPELVCELKNSPETRMGFQLIKVVQRNGNEYYGGVFNSVIFIEVGPQFFNNMLRVQELNFLELSKNLQLSSSPIIDSFEVISANDFNKVIAAFPERWKFSNYTYYSIEANHNSRETFWVYLSPLNTYNINRFFESPKEWGEPENSLFTHSGTLLIPYSEYLDRIEKNEFQWNEYSKIVNFASLKTAIIFEYLGEFDLEIIQITNKSNEIVGSMHQVSIPHLFRKKVSLSINNTL
ncbi:MAG: hypothetical protein N4A41_08020 [Crocinitomicaceae bacterium]|jgi:hypothetical protein|nr:hypothetical protein [Crocinitomicaceae bacterium]